MKYIILVLTLFICLQSTASESIKEDNKKTFYIKIDEPQGLDTKQLKKCHEIDKQFSYGKLSGNKAIGIIEFVPNEMIGDVVKCSYVKPEGQELERKSFKKIYTVVNCNYGCLSNKTFSLPNLRGKFRR